MQACTHIIIKLISASVQSYSLHIATYIYNFKSISYGFKIKHHDQLMYVDCKTDS